MRLGGDRSVIAYIVRFSIWLYSYYYANKNKLRLKTCGETMIDLLRDVLKILQNVCDLLYHYVPRTYKKKLLYLHTPQNCTSASSFTLRWVPKTDDELCLKKKNV